MVCEKADTVTASFLGYPVTLLFITRYSYSIITASFIKTVSVISFPATDSRIACIYMASRSVALVSE